MMGMILMIVGVAAFIAGVILYTKTNKVEELVENGNELNKLIQMAIADGVLTENERQLIQQLAEEKGVDFNEIIKDIENQLSKLKIDSETELIDKNKKNGDDFEKYVVEKFSKKYFKVKEWRGDKFVNGRYANTNMHPDLQMEFILREDTAVFSLECKWRQKLFKNGFEFQKTEQLERYKAFEEQQQQPVFIAIGIGGKGALPEQLYIVPLKEFKNNFIHLNTLKKYEKKVGTQFFFNNEKKELS